MIELKIERLVHGGQGLAHDEKGHPYFVWNALPGEVVMAERLHKTKDHSEAIAREIITASPHRIPAKEDSYLSTSPWQIMTHEYERAMKIQIAQETFMFHTGIVLPDLQIYQTTQDFGYRNKMEFSFYVDDETGIIDLAFFARGQKNKVPVQDSMLATPAINMAARHILAWVRACEIPRRSLKTVIIRSNQAGQVIAGLFIKDEMQFDAYPELNDQLIGFQLYYSTHKSPASVPTKLLYSVGQDYLAESIMGKTLNYGLMSFFQVHVPVFEQVLRDITPFIDEAVPYLDYYAGVGSISLGLSDLISQAFLVEENTEAAQYAQRNIVGLSLSARYETLASPAEAMLADILSDRNVIIDPPRAGLHLKVTERILEMLPTQIIYLSCNPVTQARDLALLASHYEIVFSRLYNFFPRTPHIESLIILHKK